jgi:hypothetical protein
MKNVMPYEGLAVYDKYDRSYIHLAHWFVKKYTFKRILETLAHEIAHILDSYMRNTPESKWHDRYWQKLNWICGGDRYNYPYKPRKKK